MYAPPLFDLTDAATIRGIIRANPFATLVSTGEDGAPFVTHGRSVPPDGARFGYRTVLSPQAAPHFGCYRHQPPRGSGARDEFGLHLAHVLDEALDELRHSGRFGRPTVVELDQIVLIVGHKCLGCRFRKIGDGCCGSIGFLGFGRRALLLAGGEESQREK